MPPPFRLALQLGPVFWMVGLSTLTPFYLITAFLMLAAWPIHRLRGHEPTSKFLGGGSPLLLFRKAPTVASACIVAVGLDLALISLVPAKVA